MSKTLDTIRHLNRHFCSAVVLAAGDSVRFGGGDKLAAALGGMPVLARCLSVLEKCGSISEIIVVTAADRLSETAALCMDYGITKAAKIVVGGKTRAESSLAGVCAISPRAKLVAIHDGGRPLVTADIVDMAVHMAALHKAAAPFVPLRDTVVSAENDFITDSPERASLTAIQTPQVFIPEIISAALTDAIKKGVALTDDTSAVRRLGFPVRLFPGSEENIKITTRFDLDVANLILSRRTETA